MGGARSRQEPARGVDGRDLDRRRAKVDTEDDR
jgi:hypothetical protein